MSSGRWPQRISWPVGLLLGVAALSLVGMSVWWWQAPSSNAGRVDRVSSVPDSRNEMPAQAPQIGASAGRTLTASVTADVRLEPHARAPSAPARLVEQVAARADSRQDDWETEPLAEAATRQLARLQALLEQPAPPDDAALEPLVAPQFATTMLRPAKLEKVYDDGLIRVDRPTDDAPLPTIDSTGAAALQQVLAELMTSLGHGNEGHVKFKLYRIQRQADFFDTQVRYEASRLNEREGREQTAIWNCQWTYPTDADPSPRLQRVTLALYEESQIRAPHGRLFIDCTASALESNSHYHEQVVPGLNHWLPRTPREFFGQFGHHGLAIGDCNGDGLDDLYVCDAGGLPNRLYIQQHDGTAVDIAAEVGVDLLDDATAALLVDLDNDGDQDLVVGIDPTLQIAENDGTGRFTWRPGIDVETDTFSISAADYDRDGDLDLYLCGYNVRKKDPTDRGLPFPVPFHDANNGGRNVLLRNEGNLQFVDATRETALNQNNSRFSLAAAWEDVDNDGDLDLYVANDFGRNNLYRNDGSRFVDIAATAGVEDQASGMSVSWADYNRDGRMDVYVGNMFSSAGNRVTFQNRFSLGRSDDTVAHLRHMARGNTLFENIGAQGSIEFRDVSESQAVEMGRWAWASRFVDLTNDGWPDLVVANGYVTNTRADDL